MTAQAAGSGVLTARGVGKSFGSLLVLQELDLQVRAGQTLALLGPSGCGKSTLLRVLAGFETVDVGQVAVDGRPVMGPSPQRGMVAQSSSLFPWLTVADNIGFGPRERGANDVDALVRDMLEVTGLGEFANALPRQLSGGMRQRAAFAQVLINRPPLLLLDEPFAALDALTRLTMQDFVGELTAALGTTVVLVTHDVDEALRLADRVAVLGPAGSGACDVVDLPARDGTREPRDSGDPGTAATLAPLRRTLLRHAGLVA